MQFGILAKHMFNTVLSLSIFLIVEAMLAINPVCERLMPIYYTQYDIASCEYDAMLFLINALNHLYVISCHIHHVAMNMAKSNYAITRIC